MRRNSTARCRAAREQDLPLLCQPSKTLRAGCESAPGVSDNTANTLRHLGLKPGVEPGRMIVPVADGERQRPCGCPARLDRADVQRVADDIPYRRPKSRLRQLFRIARQKRRERRESVDAGRSEAADCLHALLERGAMRLVELANLFAIGGDGEAHSQR